MAITAYLLYRDAGAAVDWLAQAFGLEKDEVLTGADGRVQHASMKLGESLVMLGSPGPDFKGPRALGAVTQNLYVDIDDLEAHHARAVEAGASIIEQPKDTPYGARRYGAEDLEGHRWYFAQELSVRRKRAAKPARRNARKKAKARGRKRSSRR